MRLLALGSLIGALCSACGGQPIFEPASSFIDVRIVNDSTARVNVAGCFNLLCTNHDVTDTLSPGAVVDQAVFSNYTAGVARYRATDRFGRSKCAQIRFHAHEPQATLYVTDMSSCP
jgi:hypothetical protein